MKQLFIHWSINSMAFGIAMLVIAGIKVTGEVIGIVFVALIFGLLSALLSPLLWLLTFPLLLVTVGPMVLFLNVVMLWASTLFAGYLGVDFRIDGMWPVLLVALVVALTQVTTYGFLWYQRSILFYQKKQIWVLEMEKYRRWLEEQTGGWKILAEKREQIISEQQSILDRLRAGQLKSEEIKTKYSHLLEVKHTS